METYGRPVLCFECQGIAFDDVLRDAVASSPGSPRWNRRDTLPDLPTLTASASAGCTFCRHLKFTIEEKLPLQLQSALTRTRPGSVITVCLGSPAYVLRSEVQEVRPGWENVDHREEPDGLYWLSLIFHHDSWDAPWEVRAWVYAGTDAVSKHLGITMRMPASSCLDEDFTRRIRDWLSSCERDHALCQQPAAISTSATRPLPTRLVDIGDRKSSSSSTSPRLITSEKLPCSTKYIALSYCWGKPSETKPQLTTTMATLPDRLSSIPLSIMPGTFQDLVAVARLVNIRYLWIDALCIIQGDDEDWKREAARMFEVYRHADLTVVAAAGDSCHSDFLQRNRGVYATVPFRSRMDGIGVSGSYLLYFLNDRRTWDVEIPQHLHRSSWAERAWTLQEDMMSTRVLYLDRHTSYFRCQTSRCLEQSTVTYPARPWHNIVSPTNHDDVEGRQITKNNLFSRWKFIVETYTMRKMTMQRDKLPALSGLARAFAGALDDIYVAGIWRGDLVSGMLWGIDSDAEKPAIWRAPSWSWAAWQGSVWWFQHDSTKMEHSCTVEEVHTQPDGADPFGALSGGWIIVRSRITKVTLRPRAGGERERRSLYADVIGSKGSAIAVGAVDAISKAGLKADETWKPPPLDNLVDMTDVLALVLCNTTFESDDGESGSSASMPARPAGILVRPVQNGARLSAFERVGLFAVDEEQYSCAWDDCSYVRVKIV